MRRTLTGLVVAATIALLPALAWADNQEIANEIAKNLRNSGQLKSYKIGVKYQDGSAWLHGQVTSEEQLNTALQVVFECQEVKRIINSLTVEPNEPATPAPEKAAPKTSTAKNPLLKPIPGALAPERTVAARSIRPAVPADTAAEPIASSFQLKSAEAVAAIQPAAQPAIQQQAVPRLQMAGFPGRPIPVAMLQAGPMPEAVPARQGPIPAYVAGTGGGVAPVRYDQPHMPNYAWPSYAAYPNYGALTYPRQYSPTAWPYIGPFYPYPQVPLGWRKVTLEWDDGWWMLDFKDRGRR
ncbi:MAG TPA: BON domain-containing protein [Thermoguttaceae bacterium]|nr:BON domain-containing protein [Thermoguttaceae bacterium]